MHQFHSIFRMSFSMVCPPAASSHRVPHPWCSFTVVFSNDGSVTRQLPSSSATPGSCTAAFPGRNAMPVNSTLEQHMVCKNGCTLYHKWILSYCDGFIGNTAQSLCVRCAARFFGRLRRNFAGILSYVKRFLCNMTENQQADCVQSRQAGFVRYCLYYTGFSGGCQRNGRVSNRRS